MTRVEWTRLSGDDVEEVVAIMVSRRHPQAVRIRPSRGDGGIDLLVPQPDGSHHVLQVKRFAQNLKANEKRQISKSLKRLGTYMGQTGLRVSRWDLVTPLDPTNENRTWLAGLSAPNSVRVDWKGLAFVDGLAAQYPEVIDYYLRDGKERLQAAMADLTALLRLQSGRGQADGPLDVTDAATALEALSNQLNAIDPHYSYDLHVTGQALDLSAAAGPQPVMVWSSQGEGPVVTVVVWARFADAPRVRPITFQLNVRVPVGSDDAQALKRFQDFGTELTLTGSSYELSADLPAALAPPSATPDSLLRITTNPVPSPHPQDVRLLLTGPDHQGLAACVVTLDAVTRGITGTAGILHGREVHGCFTADLRLDTTAKSMNLTVSWRDLAGMRLEDIRDGVAFLAHLHRPNLLWFDDAHGADRRHNPQPVPHDADPSNEFLLDIVEALLMIQKAARRTIRMPQLANRSFEELTPWLEAAALLRGETVEGTWTRFSTVQSADAPTQLTADTPFAMIVHEPLAVTVGGQQLPLGYRQIHLPGVQVKDASLQDDGHHLLLEPYGSPTASIRWVETLPAGTNTPPAAGPDRPV
ncbi:hypothetical protein [Streptacidiphilus cavernicola]|uniref:Restriction endonuclease type IV Mrr domain-containing protein n=1 Tax=Streptacidiphilus cavernicola TaxID=3342716 RepID=A0ABV6W5N0_9ACTN